MIRCAATAYYSWTSSVGNGTLVPRKADNVGHNKHLSPICVRGCPLVGLKSGNSSSTPALQHEPRSCGATHRVRRDHRYILHLDVCVRREPSHGAAVPHRTHNPGCTHVRFLFSHFFETLQFFFVVYFHVHTYMYSFTCYNHPACQGFTRLPQVALGHYIDDVSKHKHKYKIRTRITTSHHME